MFFYIQKDYMRQVNAYCATAASIADSPHYLYV